MSRFSSYVLLLFMLILLALLTPIGVDTYLFSGTGYQMLVAPTWMLGIDGPFAGNFQFEGFYFLMIFWFESLTRLLLALLVLLYCSHDISRIPIYLIGVSEPVLFIIKNLNSAQPFGWWMFYPIPLFPLIIITIISVPSLKKKLQETELIDSGQPDQMSSDVKQTKEQTIPKTSDVILLMGILLFVVPATLTLAQSPPHQPTIFILALGWWIRTSPSLSAWFIPYLPISYLLLIPLHTTRLLFAWQVVRYYNHKTTKRSVLRMGILNIIVVLLLNSPSHILGLNFLFFQDFVFFFPIPILFLSGLALMERYPRLKQLM